MWDLKDGNFYGLKGKSRRLKPCNDQLGRAEGESREMDMRFVFERIFKTKM